MNQYIIERFGSDAGAARTERLAAEAAAVAADASADAAAAAAASIIATNQVIPLGTVTGTANNIIADGPVIGELLARKLMVLVPTADNSEPVQLVLDAVGEGRYIRLPSGLDLPPGTLRAGKPSIIFYDPDIGTFGLIAPLPVLTSPSYDIAAVQTNVSGNFIDFAPATGVTPPNNSGENTVIRLKITTAMGEGSLSGRASWINPVDPFVFRLLNGDDVSEGDLPVGSYVDFMRIDTAGSVWTVINVTGIDILPPSLTLSEDDLIAVNAAAEAASRALSKSQKFATRVDALETGRAKVSTIEKPVGSGNWTVPAGAKLVEVIVIGGGGGGGGGAKGAAATARSGGGGGGGGGRRRELFLAADLASPVVYVVGAGGAAGAAATVNGSGGNGGVGGQTSFGTLVYGFGGGGGSGGAIATGSAGGGGGGSVGAGASGAGAVGGGGGQNAGSGGSATVGSNGITFAGGGGGGTAAGAASTGGRGSSGGSGGGSGAGLTAANAESAGAIGPTSEGSPLVSGAAGATGGGAGGTVAALIGFSAGAGGGGGGSSASVAGGAGGAGQSPAGGGGGGGAGQAGNGGAGGVGGAGAIFVIVHF